LLYTVVYIFFLDCFTVFRWAFFLDAFILQLAWCVRPRVVYCAIAIRLCTGRNTATYLAICTDSKWPFVPVLESEFGFWDRDKMFLMLKNFCALRDSNLRLIVWRIIFLPTHLNSTCDSVKNNFLLNYHVKEFFVRVGNTNWDKRIL